MNQSNFPYQFIAIEGNIGTGKTTLCTMLAQTYNCDLVLEQFSDNPFLPYFYESPERFGFPVELFFMTERHKQLQEHFAQPDLFSSFTVSDYFFVKTLLFAKNNLNEEEFRLFQRLFQVLNATFPKPELLVYLHRPVDILLKQIKQRGREMEKNISGEYLEEIQNAYFEYFKNVNDVPVLVVNVGESDFLQNETYYQKIIDLLKREHPNGVHFCDL